MTEHKEPQNPETARQVLTDFVTEAEQTPEVQSYEQLQSLVKPEVAAALISLILQEGHPSKYPQYGDRAILNAKHGRRMVQGVVKTRDESDEPVSVYLAELKRGLFRFRRKRWVMLSTEGVGHGSAVETGEAFYMPSLHSDDTISFYRDELGERGSPKNGLELAGEAIRERPQALNSFLRITSELTRELVSIKAV